MIQVRVLCFGVLKDWLGSAASTVELPEDATVAVLLAQLSRLKPSPILRSIAVSVNAEFTTRDQPLHEGDEVGLLPPVSGGNSLETDALKDVNPQPTVVTALTREPIDAQKLIADAKNSADGAVVVFDGIVRDNTHGRHTLYLDYESYEKMAERQMHTIAREARDRFGVRQVTLVHRLGRLLTGETSVLIVVASAHRAPAFEACRWLIESLKTTVPIWKQETFEDGIVWAPGEPFPAGLAAEAEHEP